MISPYIVFFLIAAVILIPALAAYCSHADRQDAADEGEWL